MTMTPSDRILLERNKLLRDISLESIAHVLKACSVLSLGAGKKLLDIGQKNDSLYLLLDGELHVYLDNRSLTEHATLGPGECVGELSLIDGGKTAALVIAAKDSRMLVMPYEQVWLLVDSSHAVARNLLGILAGRIRNDNLLQLTAHGLSLEFEIPENVDILTGLRNRHWMDEVFPRVISRYEHGNVPLCLMLADVDHCGDINGAFGRLAGNEVLKGVARIMAENIRPQDMLACMGGDKYAVLLPDTAPNVAMKIAERLREAVAAAALLDGMNKGGAAGRDTLVTISIGLATRQPGDVLATMLAAVEEALSKSKTAGRNRLAMAATRG
jgi:diguanylate cyclase (GGDEF)-like protein